MSTPMLMSILLLVWSAAGCMGSRDQAFPQPVVTPQQNVVGPVYGGPLGPVEGFQLLELSSEVNVPVAAVTRDSQLFYAYVDGATGVGMLRKAGGDPVRLPGEGTTSAVAMAASADGYLHLAWAQGSAVFYARHDTIGTFDAFENVARYPGPLPTSLYITAREPTLTITPGGDVVIAWTADWAPAGVAEVSRIFTVRGSVFAGPVDGPPVQFDEPLWVNAGCCEREGQSAERVSGPSLAVGPDESIHIVYEWSTFLNTTIDYVHNRSGGFGTPVTISDAAFVPCPSLVVDEAGVAHITFLRDLEPSVFYVSVTDGTKSEERAVYSPQVGRATMALTTRDGLGQFVMAITEEATERALRIVEFDGEAATVFASEHGVAKLSPRAGGFLIAPDGKAIVPFEEQSGGSSFARIAMGR